MIYTFDKNQNLIGTYDEKEELTVANLNLKINKAATLDLEFPANKENVNSLKNVVFLAVPYPNNKQKLLFLRVMTRTDKEYTIELMAKEFAYQELATSGYIEDKRFKDANAKTLISGAVQGSGYTVSNVNVSGTAQLNFYYEDYLTAVSDVIEALGGEVIFYVTLSGNKISGRYVDYVIAQGTNTSKTFAYGSNLISVERQSDASEVYTAILPRGKGELVSEGEDDAPDGYGRRINIAEILWKKPTNPLDKPVGSLVLEDPTATAAFGQLNGTARLLLKTYEDIEDKNELINAAYRDLMQYNHPATQFTASVANIGDSALGDTIVIMHSDRDMSYRTRIFEIDYDLIEINNTVATFGDNLSKNNTSSMLTSVSRAVNNVKETANFAVASANGIGKDYYGENEPTNPKNGDTWFYTAGDGFGIRQYVDGQWVEYVNSKTSEQITQQVETAIANAKEYSDGLNEKQNEVTAEINQKVANGEALLKQEITDRETGDSNTLQAGKDFTTSQITSYDTGMQSRLTQVSEGIMAQVSSTNLITDSSFVNATANWTLSGDVSWKINNEIMRKGVRAATFDNGSTNFDRKTSTLTSTPIYTMNLGGTQFYASIDIYAQSFGSSAYMKAEIVQKNSSGTTTKSTAIGGSFDTAMTDWNTYTADITLDPATTQLYLQVTQYGGGKVSIARPYLGSTKLNSGDYIPGASTDNTSTLKLFNNFFAFGIQSNTGEIISGINGDSSGLIITGKKITVSGDTTFIGNNFMDGAIIKNASIGSAQIADAAITNAKISNLDVNKLSGNVSSFIQTNWNGKYGATTIDANGMTVDTSGITTKFGSYGMTLNMTGESVGGIGVQGLTGQPSDYQGLAFWLDGNAEYMAWGARSDGATAGNPTLKLSWFRISSAPSGAYSGFNFDDDVIFNKGINVPGTTNRRIIFATKNFQNYDYPYFGDSQGGAGWAFGGSQTYMISGTTYYNATKVIAALNGIGAAKIPTAINSDGTVKTWANVTL